MRKVPAKHIQWLKKELPVLEADGVLPVETSRAIESYYSERTTSGLHWAIIAFAVLGSLLIGAGIILLIAHNWDELGRPARAALSFLPLILGSALSIVAVAKNGGTALREAAGILHALTIGASIALVGQTYHIPSNMPGFFLSWTLLSLPLMFLLRSSGAGLISLALACSWSGVAQDMQGQAAGFWLLLTPFIVRLVQQMQKDRHAPETLLNLWGVLLALCISTGIVLEHNVPGLWIIAYATMLSSAGLLGMHLYAGREGWSNPARLAGLIGATLLTYIYTFPEVWEDIGRSHIRSGYRYRTWGIWFDSAVTLAFLGGYAVTVFKTFRRRSAESIILTAFPLIAVITFITGSLLKETDELNALIFNGFMFACGLTYIVLGCRSNKLRQLNGGMAMLTLLLVTRFFDADFSFVARGIVFILLGACFLTVNLIIARRKKQKEVHA